MKLYISADIEGVAGVVSRDQGGPGKFEYEKGREWMTGEVGAACEGAFEAGVTDIVISDSHGNGQNLLLDDLPGNVRLIRSWPRPLGMMEGIQEGGFDAAILIGYHAGATNVGGNLAHTLSGIAIRSVRINGEIVPEGYISAATAGDFGVAVVFASGDNVFVEETREYLSQVETVTTKQSIGVLSANTLMPSTSRERIRHGVKAALNNRSQFAPLVVNAPVHLEVSFKHRLPAELLSYLRDVKQMDAFTIAYTGEDMSDVSRFLSFIVSYEPTLL